MKKNQLYILVFVLVALNSISIASAQEIEKVNLGTSRIDTTQVSAVSTVQGKTLESYTDCNLSNSLQGQLAGLVVRSTTNGLGNNSSNLYVRGMSRNGDSQAMVILDGMERSMDDLIPEEVATVTVLKDAAAKILYGARAANGVIIVTTKRGHLGSSNTWAKVEMGVTSMTRTPSYLNSFDYATLYNEARENDGLTPYYSTSDLDGYKNSTGNMDLRYPNVSFYDDFLDRQSSFQKVSLGVNGGTERTKYAFVANYLGTDGFEAIGDKPTLMHLNIRGNLDIKINDIISVTGDAAARLERRKYGVLDCGQVMNAITSTRPNEYPLTIGYEDLGLQQSTDNIPYFGASLDHAANLYADMAYSGFSEERYIKSENNLGVFINLNSLADGLKAKGVISFDNYNYLKQGQTNTYSTYAIQNRLADIPTFVKRKKTSLQENQSIKGETTTRSLGWKSAVDYNHLFADKHQLNASMAFNYYHREVKGMTQDIDNNDVSLTVDYGYNKKYKLLATLSSMGSNRFPEADDRFLSYAAGASWAISKEAFMNSVQWIDYLNLKASWGHLGYDRSTSALLTATGWSQGSKIKLGEQNIAGDNKTNFVRIGNSNLDWEYSNELNVGLEAHLFTNRLGIDFNYFIENRRDIIGSLTGNLSTMLGSFVYSDNIGDIRNTGFDVHADWSDKIGAVSYRLGLNATVSKNKITKWAEMPESVHALNQVGRSSTSMVGYKAVGLFGKDIPLAGSDQRLGSYQEGDIAYADLNSDGYVDQYDLMEVGNSFPTTSYGISVDLKYKQWELYLHGTGEMDVDTWANNSYYWNRSSGKYSTLAMDRYHPVNNPSGTMPRLTTTNGTNNFRNSTFWVKDASFFRLKNIELSYTFDKPLSWVNQIRVFTRGTNLFVLSNIKDLDPELINSGISNYPVTRNLSAGIAVVF